MQSKNAFAVVHAMAGMCGMPKLYVFIWNTDVGRTLKYRTLLPVQTQRTWDSSFKITLACTYLISQICVFNFTFFFQFANKSTRKNDNLQLLIAPAAL